MAINTDLSQSCWQSNQLQNGEMAMSIKSSPTNNSNTH